MKVQINEKTVIKNGFVKVGLPFLKFNKSGCFISTAASKILALDRGKNRIAFEVENKRLFLIWDKNGWEPINKTKKASIYNIRSYPMAKMVSFETGNDLVCKYLLDEFKEGRYELIKIDK